ncbi:MAG: hypothetical protein QME42_05550 [bacterium]|nr:hypothetical protein [bacterium]
MRKRGYSFRVSLENIKRFKDMPAESKLNWLEKANEFIQTTLPQEKLKIWEKIKEGRVKA